MRIDVIGAGAFGTGLAIALATGRRQVRLWARDPEHIEALSRDRENTRRLPGVRFPDTLSVTGDAADLDAETRLLAIPAQTLAAYLKSADLTEQNLVACCKGIDLTTLTGPTATIRAVCADATPAMLTGPSFAADIARGLPTALTLAAPDEARAKELQDQLGTDTLRLYRTTDMTGAELGGALKNVIAIACGAAIGAGLGESARAALMTRGYAEMQRLAITLGAQPETLSGLSGFGDLALTCTSRQSRNFRFGQALAQGETLSKGTTVEGASTARAALDLAAKHKIDMPITAVVTDLVKGTIGVADAMERLLARPQTKE